MYGYIDSTIKLQQAAPLTVDSQIQLVGPADGSALTITLAELNTPEIGILTISAGAEAKMSDLMITGGNPASGSGAGIWNAGRLTVDRVTVANNAAAAGEGGGMYNAAGGEVVFRNSTVSGNSALGDGGGIYNAGSFEVVNGTIANNASSSAGSGVFSAAGATSTVRNSLIATNSGDADTHGSFVSLGHNLVGNADNATGFGATGDQIGTAGSVIDPLIGPLLSNGGAASTHALLPGSRAIDRADNRGATTLDQRGAPRVLDGPDPLNTADAIATSDIGAFEFGTFFVNSETDAIDASPLGDGRVDTDLTEANDQVSIRAALQELNRLAGWDGSNQPTVQVMEGVVMFHPGLATLTITVEGANEDLAATGDLDVFGNLTIRGWDPAVNGSQPSIDAGWGPTTPTGVDLKDRVFHMLAGSRLMLDSVSVRGGHLIPEASIESRLGGAVFNDAGTLEIVDSTFGFSSGGRGGSEAEKGGGIYTRNGTVSIARTRFNGHRAVHGGTIYIESGTVTIDDQTQIVGSGADYRGGGILLDDGELLITGQSGISESFVFGTEDQGNVPDGERGVGGGLAVMGGKATISGQSRISGNVTTPSSNSWIWGGGIYNAAELRIEDGSYVDGNGSWGSSLYGAGIYNRANLTLLDAFVDENQSAAGGAGIYNVTSGTTLIERTSISGNSGNHWGTALYNDNGLVTLVENRIADNTNPMYAPGILNFGLDARLIVTDSVFDGNSSENSGGGIWNHHGTVYVSGSTFVDNSSGNGGGTGGGGAILHLGKHLLLGETPERFLTLAADVNPTQSTIFVVDPEPILGLPLPLGIMVGNERMRVTEVDGFRGAITVERSGGTAHSVTDKVTTYIDTTQQHLTLGDPGVIGRYQLPLDILVDYEVMTVTALEGDLAIVERGRNGTVAASHRNPVQVWGVAGALTIADSTFTGNRVDTSGTGNYDMGGALFNAVEPFARPTVIETSTFDGNRAYAGAAIFTSLEDSWFTPTTWEPPEWQEDWPSSVSDSIPSTSMWMQNTVINGGMRPEGGATLEVVGSIDMHGDNVFDGFVLYPPDSLASGGNNLTDADFYFYTSTTDPLTETATSFHAAEPHKGLPAVPFSARVSHWIDREIFHEEMVVTGVSRDAEGNLDSLTVLRAQNGAAALPHPAGARITISASGFTKPTDRHGTLQKVSNSFETRISAGEGITDQQLQFEVTDTTNFPEAPFKLRVTHFDNLTPVFEQMLVTAVQANTVTVERGQDATTPIAHPKESVLTFKVELSSRLDAGLAPLKDTGGPTPVQTAVPDSPLLDRGNAVGFAGSSVTSASGLVSAYQLTPAFYFDANPSAFTTETASFTFLDDTTIAVADATVFPASPFWIRIADEVMQVTDVDVLENVVAVMRGQAGTLATDHDAANQILYGEAISASTGEATLNVDDASSLPAVPFVVRVGNELLRVTDVDPLHNFVTTQRGVLGSLPQPIAAGAAAAPDTYLQLQETDQLKAGDAVRIGDELLTILSLDLTHKLAIVERGAQRTTPASHRPNVTVLYGNDGTSEGFHGRWGLLSSDVTSATQTEITIEPPRIRLPSIFHIRLGDETAKVTSYRKNSDGFLVLTVERGVDGTLAMAEFTAGSHVLLMIDQRGARRMIDGDADLQQTMDIGAAESIVFVVNTTADTPDLNPGDGMVDTGTAGEISLRAAIMEINELAGTGTVILPSGQYPLSATLDVMGSVEIVGNDSLPAIIGSSNRLFHVHPQASLHLTKVELTGGDVDGDGGAVFIDHGTLSVEASYLYGNAATRGGAVASNGGLLTIIGSLLSNNTSVTDGGAIFISDGSLDMRNSTLSGSMAGGDGGGVFVGATASASIRNSTVTGNAASQAGGVHNAGATEVGNTITAGNSASVSEPDLIGNFASFGGNVIGARPSPLGTLNADITSHQTTLNVLGLDNVPEVPFTVLIDLEQILVTGIEDGSLTVVRGQNGTAASVHSNGAPVRADGLWQAGDQAGTAAAPLDPMLGPLHMNGGLMPTHALAGASPAVDAGNDAQFTGLQLPFDTSIGARVVTVANWRGLPPVPFDVRFGNETVRVVEVDAYRLHLADPVTGVHRRGEIGQLLTDQRGAPRFFGEDADKIDAGAYELVAEISLGSAQSSLVEGDSGTTAFTFTVTRSGRTTGVTSVDYFVVPSGQHPAGPADFGNNALPRGTITFAAGETSKNILIDVVGDDVVEGNESFTVRLENATAGAWIVDAIEEAEIQNDDSAAITISSPMAREGLALVFDVSLNAPVQGGFEIPWNSADDTAVAATGDYLPRSGDLFFAGLKDESYKLVVPTIADNIIELDEILKLQFGNLAIHPDLLASITVASPGIGTIENDDTTTLTVRNIREMEGASGTTTFQYDVVLYPNPLDVGFDVEVAPVAGTATGDNDFSTASSSLSFTGSAGEVVVGTLSVFGDLVSEADEVLTLQAGTPMASGRETSITRIDGTATILNDDDPRIIVRDLTQTELDAATSVFAFDVVLLNPTGSVSVDVATTDDTAIADAGGTSNDYAPHSQTLSFSGVHGETQSFSVQVRGDEVVELDEMFHVALSNLQAGGNESAYTLVDGIGTIVNDDSATLTVAVGSGESCSEAGDPRVTGCQNEGDGDVIFRLVLDGAVDVPFTVAAAAAAENASDQDFTASAQDLSFTGADGQTVDYLVSIPDDSTIEAGDKTFALALSNLQSSGRNVVIGPAAVARIRDDDRAQPRVVSPCDADDDGGNTDGGGGGSPGMSVPTLVTLVEYEGPDGLLAGKYVDPDGNEVTDLGSQYTTNPNEVPSLKHAVAGDIGYGIDLYGYAVVPVTVDGVVYLIGSVDRLNYGQPWDRMADGNGGGKDYGPRGCAAAPEEPPPGDDDPPPATVKPIQADWTVPHTGSLTFNPFPTFNYRLIDDPGVTIASGTGFARIGDVVPLQFGTITVNADMTLTYDPYDDLTGRTGSDALRPEFDANGNVVRFTGIENFEAHIVNRSVIEPLDPNGPEGEGPAALPLTYASVPVELAVSNHLPTLRGDRMHASGPTTAALDLDSPVFADFETSYRIDLRDLFGDLDGEGDLGKLRVVDVNYSGRSLDEDDPATTPDNEDPDGDPQELRVVIGATQKLVNGFYVDDQERDLIVRRVGSRSLEVHNTVSASDVSGDWNDNYPSQVSLFVRVTDDTPDETKPITDDSGNVTGYEPYTWKVHVDLRPRNQKAHQFNWRTLTNAPEVDFRPWVAEVTPTLPERYPNASGEDAEPTLNPADWRIISAQAGVGRNTESVGGVDVDLHTGEFRRYHDLILDGSGGASEMAIPGLVYDSSTMHVDAAAMPVVQAVLKGDALPAGSTITANLTWYNANGPQNTSWTADQAAIDASQEEFVIAVSPPLIDGGTGVYGWELTVDISNGTDSFTLRTAGETPVVAAGDASIFGKGWQLAGVPSLSIGYRDESSNNAAFNSHDDRILLAFPGEAPKIFNASDLTYNDHSYAGALPSLQPGSTEISYDGFADPQEFGTLTSRQNPDELVYDDGTGKEYVFVKHVNDNETPTDTTDDTTSYLIDRIEQPGIDFDTATNTWPAGRRGISFVWDTNWNSLATDEHPILRSLTATDGVETEFDYNPNGYVERQKVFSGGVLVREVEFFVSASGQLGEVYHKADPGGTYSAQDRIRRFLDMVFDTSGAVLHEYQGRLATDRWYNGSEDLVRHTQFLYENNTGTLSQVQFGDGTEENTIVYDVIPASTVGWDGANAVLSDLVGRVEIAVNYERYDEETELSESAFGTSIVEHQFTIDGLPVRREEFFQPATLPIVSDRESISSETWDYDHVGSVKRYTDPLGRQTYYWRDYETPLAYESSDLDDPALLDDEPRYDPSDYRGNVTHIVTPAGQTIFEYETDNEELAAVGTLVKETDKPKLSPTGDPAPGGTVADAVTVYERARDGRPLSLRAIRGVDDSNASADGDDPEDYVEKWTYDADGLVLNQARID